MKYSYFISSVPLNSFLLGRRAGFKSRAACGPPAVVFVCLLKRISVVIWIGLIVNTSMSLLLLTFYMLHILCNVLTPTRALQLRRPPSVPARGQRGLNGQHGSSTAAGHRGLRPPSLHVKRGAPRTSRAAQQQRRGRRRRLWLLASHIATQHTHGTHFSILFFLFPFIFFFFLFFSLFNSLRCCCGGQPLTAEERDSSRQPTDRKSLRSHGRHKPGCIWCVLILSSFFIIMKGNWFYFIVEENPKRMFFNKSVVLFWLLKTTDLMAVVTVLPRAPADRIGVVCVSV